MPDFQAVNAYFGTAIQPSDITVHLAAPLLQGLHLPTRWLEAVPVSLPRVRWAVLMMLARQMAAEYDVLVSAENEADFGRQGIQYVNYPRLRRPSPREVVRWYHHPRFVVERYDALFKRVLNFSVERIERNRTLTVSAWTAAYMRRLYTNMNIPCIVYPPVSGSLRDVPWEHRENGFVCIGRLAPEKQLEKVVEIVAAVRQHVPGLHLHLVGDRERRSYYRRIRRLAAAHSEWLHLDEGLSRVQLLDLVSMHRYGIHGMKEEHFGIAPAEMVRAGCVVFVPNGGGQVEIVGEDERLTYSTKDEAVAKIVHALSHPAEIASLRRHLATRRDLFSPESFMAAIRIAVETIVAAPVRHDAERGWK